jgi:hypothetical protein
MGFSFVMWCVEDDGKSFGDQEDFDYVALSRERSGVGVSIFCLIFFPFGRDTNILRTVLDRQFQCRQCQDLLENNLAHKRPIEGTIPLFPCISGIHTFMGSACREEESGSPADCYQ